MAPRHFLIRRFALHMYTLPMVPENLTGEHVQDTELMMAGAVLIILPVRIVFVTLQKIYQRDYLWSQIEKIEEGLAFANRLSVTKEWCIDLCGMALKVKYHHFEEFCDNAEALRRWLVVAVARKKPVHSKIHFTNFMPTYPHPLQR